MFYSSNKCGLAFFHVKINLGGHDRMIYEFLREKFYGIGRHDFTR